MKVKVDTLCWDTASFTAEVMLLVYFVLVKACYGWEDKDLKFENVSLVVVKGGNKKFQRVCVE